MEKEIGVAPATPTAGLGVAGPPPWPRGWSGHPKRPKKKKKKQRIGFGLLGVDSTTPYSQYVGGRTTPMAKGWSGHPQKPKKKKKTNNGFWPFGGGPATPTLAWSHPDFLLHLFFSFFIFKYFPLKKN